MNVPGDVRYAQFLLSDWLLREGKQALKVDGKCGPLTNKTIAAFQADYTPQFHDGRLNPNGPTIKALERIHQASIQQPLLGDASVYPLAAMQRGRQLTVADLELMFEYYLASLRQDFGG